MRAEKIDHKFLIIRRGRVAEEIRSMLRKGVKDRFPNARRYTWAKTVAYMVGRGYFTYRELKDHARMFVERWGDTYTCTPGFDKDEDLLLLKTFEAFLHNVIRDEKRWEGAQARWNSGEVAAGRAEQQARQALLYGLCPLCGAVLPCAFHKVPRMKIDGKGGLVEDDGHGTG